MPSIRFDSLYNTCSPYNTTLGGVHTFRVPDGVTSLTIDANGSGGYVQAGTGRSKGARVQTTLAVFPNQLLYIYAAPYPYDFKAANTGACNGGDGGANADGAGIIQRGDGGGTASEVRDASQNRLVVAGGGGGNGGRSNLYAGGIGGDAGQNGSAGTDQDTALGGGGGSGANGGAGGWGDGTGSIGTAGTNNAGGGHGGNGGTGRPAPYTTGYSGGGGGGGYGGGGGGGGVLSGSAQSNFGGGGGGGSSYAGTGTSSTTYSTSSAYYGYVIVTWTDPAESASFVYTGSQQTFVVPTGVNRIDFSAKGGSAAYWIGSYSATPMIKGTLAVTPGETLYITVGGRGVRGDAQAGGWPDGGTSGSNKSTIATYALDNKPFSGGGSSDIRQGGSTIGYRVVIAGGAGGDGGYGCNIWSTSYGYPTILASNTGFGGNGTNSTSSGVGGNGSQGYTEDPGEGSIPASNGGAGGTGSAVGSGGLANNGTGATAGTAGTYQGNGGTGGNGSTNSSYIESGGGGGGGGGYYPGGGGSGAGYLVGYQVASGGGGGNGSSFANSSVTSNVSYNGTGGLTTIANSAGCDGFVMLSWMSPARFVQRDRGIQNQVILIGHF